MPTRFLISTFLFTLLISACSTTQPVPVEMGTPTALATQQELAEPVPAQTQETVPAPNQEATTSSETAPLTCLGDQVSPIGQSIADEYEFVSYEQVMDWFCDGAEFEDILVALETESQTGTPAKEMLQMLADGYTWEEIWQMIGLTD